MAFSSRYLITACVIGTWLGLGTGEFLEMTHYLDVETTLYWPGHGPFRMSPLHAGEFKNFEWVAYNEIHMPEHIGTHLDAPNHFVKGGKFIGDLELRDLIGPGVVIDITHRSHVDRNAALMVRDLTQWEEEHGRIPDGAIVLMNSGWDKYWMQGNATAFLGGQGSYDLNFPGFSKEAAEFLAYERNIKMIGSDTVSGDVGNSETYPVHGILLPNDILIIENVKNVGRLPPAGATVFVMPINIQKGTGAPVRMFATWGDEPLLGQVKDGTNAGTTINFSFLVMSLVLLIGRIFI